MRSCGLAGYLSFECERSGHSVFFLPVAHKFFILVLMFLLKLIFYSTSTSSTTESLMADWLLIFHWPLPGWLMARRASVNHPVRYFNDLCESAKDAAAIKTPGDNSHTLSSWLYIMAPRSKKHQEKYYLQIFYDPYERPNVQVSQSC